MRRLLFVFSALAVGLILVVPGDARQTANSLGTVAGAGQSAGGFFGGYMPTNIVNQPTNIGNATKPINFNNVMTPQQQSPKVVNINGVFHNWTMPVFKVQAPSVPIVKSGKNNPIQPTNAFKLNPQKVPAPNPFWPF